MPLDTVDTVGRAVSFRNNNFVREEEQDKKRSLHGDEIQMHRCKKTENSAPFHLGLYSADQNRIKNHKLTTPSCLLDPEDISDPILISIP